MPAQRDPSAPPPDRHIVAMGGGGFSMEPDNPLLDRYVLGLTGQSAPKVGFLPQASSESRDYVVRFYDAMTKLGARPTWFSFFGRVDQGWEERLLDQDVIYVGGGNTRSMLAVWREWGVDTLLQSAHDRGTVLCGVSAGAICWYEYGVTDSVWPLGTIPCLGMLPGAACPHYDGEAERRPTLLKFAGEGAVPATIALEDSAAAHYINGELHRVVASIPTARAYTVTQRSGAANETELPVSYLG